MEQNPSLESDSSSTSHEDAGIEWKPQVLFEVTKKVRILSQINPVYAFLFDLF